MTIPQDDTAQLRARIDQLEERQSERIREINRLTDELREAHRKHAITIDALETTAARMIEAGARVAQLEREIGDVDSKACQALRAERDRLRAALQKCFELCGVQSSGYARDVCDVVDAALAPDSGAPQAEGDVARLVRLLRESLACGRLWAEDEKWESAYALLRAAVEGIANGGECLAGAPAPVRDESVPPPGWHDDGDGWWERDHDTRPPERRHEAWKRYDAEHGYAPGATRDETVWLQNLVTRMPDLSREELEGSLHERLYQSERGATRDDSDLDIERRRVEALKISDARYDDAIRNAAYELGCMANEESDPEHDRSKMCAWMDRLRKDLRHALTPAAMVPHLDGGATRDVREQPDERTQIIAWLREKHRNYLRVHAPESTMPLHYHRGWCDALQAIANLLENDSAQLSFAYRKPDAPQVPEAAALRRWRTWGKRSDGEFGCDECCNGDRCDEPRHYDRRGCPACGGTGALDENVIDWAASTKCPNECKPQDPATRPEDSKKGRAMADAARLAREDEARHAGAENEDEAPLPEGWEVNEFGKATGPGCVVVVQEHGMVDVCERRHICSAPAAVLRALLGASAPDPRYQELRRKHRIERDANGERQRRITELERRIERAVAELGYAEDSDSWCDTLSHVRRACEALAALRGEP